MQDNRLVQWLIQRGITPSVIESFSLQVTDHYLMGECIRIPINDTGFSKYRRDPAQDMNPRYTSDTGLKATLYGIDKIVGDTVLITEGELDTLVAWSNNIPAVSSSNGSKTFNDEWAELLKDKQVTLCFDNDDAGVEGMIKVLKLIPQAKVALIPEKPNIKDITDYVKYGGDLHQLIRSAKHYVSIEQVKDEMADRISVFDSVRFHEAYIDEFTPKVIPNSRYVKRDNSDVELAKTVPVGNLVKFSRHKANCIWHNERTPSLQYYPKTNSVYCFGCGKAGDAIDVYREIHGCDFKTAVKELKKMV